MKANLRTYKAHLCMLAAAIAWGLMAPIGKAAMEAGVSGLMMANLRMLGAAACFWLTSCLTRREHVSPHDLLMLFPASLLCIVFNQGCYTFGLSLTSPVDASLMTTTMPIVTMILAAIFLKEPVTPLKIIGVAMGSLGALALIVSNAGTVRAGEGSVAGDVLVVVAQTSFALYLTLFKRLIARYSVITLMKWMFTYAAILFIPVSYHDFAASDLAAFPPTVWLEVGYVVVFGTYVAYILMVIGQKVLRPTVVSMYNYVQPVVGSSVSVIIGMATFGWVKAVAAVCIFTGVYLVTQSKSREQMSHCSQNGQ